MAKGQQIDSIPVNHPVLGPAVSVYEDRGQALGVLFLYAAFFFLGLLGVVLGNADLSGGIAALGLAEIAGGIFLSLYSARAAFIAIRRLRQPVALVVGRDGFECDRGNGPVRWDEVASVGDPGAPPNRPRMLRAQLIDPQDYVRRHALSPFAVIELRVHHNDLYLGNSTKMPVAAIQALMNERLAEFRHAGHDAAAPKPTRAPKRRRRTPKQ